MPLKKQGYVRIGRLLVKDEHYDHFNDVYSHDRVCQDIMEAIINAIRNENFPVT